MLAVMRTSPRPASGLPVARRIIRAGLARAFGGPPLADDVAPGDPGLCGPGSASWRIIAEPAAIVGGIRALLVQLLHPLAMAGVADHSRFRTDALGRLHGTAAYVTTTTFGSMPEVLRVARMVRGAHRSVRGIAADGRPYAADDPRLLSWVSVALTSSFLATDRAYAPGRVDPAEEDAFVAQQSRGAALLDPRVDLDAVADDGFAALRAGTVDLPLIAEGHLPMSRAQLDDLWDDFADELHVTQQGRDAVRFLLWPDIGNQLRAGYLPMLAGAAATLAPGDRRRLGIPGSRAAASAVRINTRATIGGMRMLVGTSPSAEAARRRAAAAPAVPGT